MKLGQFSGNRSDRKQNWVKIREQENFHFEKPKNNLKLV